MDETRRKKGKNELEENGEGNKCKNVKKLISELSKNVNYKMFEINYQDMG